MTDDFKIDAEVKAIDIKPLRGLEVLCKDNVYRSPIKVEIKNVSTTTFYKAETEGHAYLTKTSYNNKENKVTTIYYLSNKVEDYQKSDLIKIRIPPKYKRSFGING